MRNPKEIPPKSLSLRILKAPNAPNVFNDPKVLNVFKDFKDPKAPTNFINIISNLFTNNQPCQAPRNASCHAEATTRN